jgi:succinate dehydrogenase/fumarate reductase-like Fe-S protein
MAERQWRARLSSTAARIEPMSQLPIVSDFAVDRGVLCENLKQAMG